MGKQNYETYNIGVGLPEDTNRPEHHIVICSRYWRHTKGAHWGNAGQLAFNIIWEVTFYGSTRDLNLY